MKNQNNVTIGHYILGKSVSLLPLAWPKLRNTPGLPYVGRLWRVRAVLTGRYGYAVRSPVMSSLLLMQANLSEKELSGRWNKAHTSSQGRR